MVLTFKHTDFQAQGAEIRVRFGWGEKALDPAARLPAALGAGVFPMGGLGKMDFEQICFCAHQHDLDVLARIGGPMPGS